MNTSLMLLGRAVAVVLVVGLFAAGSPAEHAAAGDAAAQAAGAPPPAATFGSHDGPPLRDLDFLVAGGDFVLEGRVYPAKGGESMPFRGVWTRRSDGSIKREFLRLDAVTGEWVRFFVGTSRRPSL